MIKKITLFIILLCCPLLVEAKTLYVNSGTGNDSTTYAANDAAHPWATIGRAAWGSTTRSSPNTSEAAQAGDTVLIAAGTYNASAASGERYDPAFNPANSGTSGNVITFRGVGTVTLQSTNGNGPVIGTVNKNYVTWDNFYIDEANVNSASDTGPVVVWSSTYVTISNITIKAKMTAWVDNHNGIRIENSDYTNINNCKIYDVGDNASYGQNSAAIMLYDTNYSTIENNELYSCGVGVYVKGIHPGETQAGNIIRKNLIYSMGHSGIVFAGSDGGRAYQNIFRDNNMDCEFWSFSGGDHRSNYFVNNTGVRVTGWFGHVSYRGEPDQYTGSLVQNNVFVSTTHDYMIGTWTYPETAPNITFNYNNYYDFTESMFWYGESAASKTFAQWQTFSGDDANSIVTDPQLTNLSANVLTLQVGSPALTLGVDILDLDGDSATDDTIPAGAYITGSETIGLDSAPYVSSVSSSKANGSYKAGEVIDIDVTFSENVTSTGNVTVTLETGDTDRTCTFTVSDASTGTCNYTVQAGDTSADLTVNSIAGTVADGDSNAMTTPTTPATNLAANKAIVIDTTVPTLSGLSPSGTIAYTATKVLTLTTSETATCRYHATESAWASMDAMSTTGSTTHNQTVNVSASTAYTFNVLCQDTATNESAAGQWSFTVLGNEPPINIGSGGSLAIGTGGSINFVISP